MTDHGTSATDWAPDACILPTAERPLRTAEFDALFAKSARDARRLDACRLRVLLSGGIDLEQAVRDLTDRESECCSFFTFVVTSPRPGRVQLDVEVPTGHVDVLDALQLRAAAVRANASVRVSQ